MSTGPTTLPENRPRQRTGRRWIPRLQDARIRSKLAMILVVPVTAVLALATVRLVAIGQGALEADMVRSLTSLSADVSALVEDVHKERMAAAAYLATSTTDVESYNLRVRETDERIRAYQDERRRIGEVPASVEERLRTIDDHLITLGTTRQDVLNRRQMPVAEAVLRYGVVIADLVAYSDALGQLSGEGHVADSLRSMAAFARAKAAVGEEEAVIFAALSSREKRLDEEQFASFLASLTSQQEALLSFALTATPHQRTFVEASVTGDAVLLADHVSTEVTRSVGQRSRVSAVDAARAVGAVHNLMRWAEIQLEGELGDQVNAVRVSVIRQAIIETAVVLVTLIVALVLAVALARSLNRSLRRLREGALAVANHDLPDAVARLRDARDLDDGSVDEIVRQVRDPIRLTSRDEVGQVAQAFNVVHREAVRIAAEQAALRTSVSTMFLNLARRSQALVDRMIGELDLVERGEEDPKRLAKLFELDHLATRMRRNDENLLILAGADSAPPRREDALLIDALRAAQSEVEAYARIEFGSVDTDVSIVASAVNDVVRLVAELLDNATRFSPPSTAVVTEARRVRDYVVVQVEDQGLGMTDEQLETLNRRLSEPSEVDVSAFRLMGLAVVGRLAARYGIRVELRRNLDGGTIAQVMLPSSIIVLPAVSGREHFVPRPRQPLAVEAGRLGNSAMPATLAEQAPPARSAAATLADQWRSAPAVRELAEQPQGTGFAPVTVQAQATQVTPPAVAHQFTPSLSPAAGLPAGPVAGLGTSLSATGAAAPAATGATAASTGAAPATGRPEDAGEAPIFREMEAVWFRVHGQDATQIFTMPPLPPAPASAEPVTVATPQLTPARSALPTRTPGQAAPPPEHPMSSAAPTAPPEAPAVAQAYTGPTIATPAVAAPAPADSSSPTQSWRTAADEGWEMANRAANPADGGTTRSGLPKRVPQAQLVPGGVEAPSGRERARRTPDEVRGLLSAYHRGVQRGRAACTEQYGNSKETNE